MFNKLMLKISTCAPEDEEKWQKDLQEFFKKDEATAERTRSLEFMGLGNIGYSLISEEDLPSLETGLDLGFGRIEILKWAVHNLIEKGIYEEAIRFADKIIAGMPETHEIFEIWHLKGIALFHVLNLEGAEKSMQKALTLNGADRNTQSDLVRLYVVAGKFSEARTTMEKVIAQHGLTPEDEYIFNVIKQNNDQRAKVSLLILCRDEDEYIGRALKSVESIFDEIVAVDTGSTDKTLDILRENDVKIVPHLWNDDFAEARNCGLNHVTGDYIFSMDADEYLEDKDRLSFLVFKNLLPLQEKTAVVFDIQTLNGYYDIKSEGIPPVSIIKRTALFPNDPEIRFRGKALESVASSLETLHIPLLFAASIAIKHHNRNNALRSRRKIAAMGNSVHDFDVEKLFQGIQFWLDVGDVNQAVHWLDEAIIKANGNSRYLNRTCKLFDEFKHNGVIQSHPQILRKLLSCYGTSYRIATLGADYLYGLKEYEGASKLLKRLVNPKDHQFTDKPALMDIQRNRLIFAMVSLERDDFETCNEMLALLSGDDDTDDAARAVSFYQAIRKRELDRAIAVLDRWIKERNLPIQGSIDDFAGFIRLIADFAEVITQYGRIGAASILIRSADYFASTIAKGM